MGKIMDSTPSETIETFEIDNLELILSESKNMRIEYLENMSKNREFVWKQISMLTFLLGAFIGFMEFIKDDWKPETTSFSLACGYVLFAFLLSLYEIYPNVQSYIIEPEDIYGLISERKDISLLLFIETYLKQLESLFSVYERTILVRELITVLTLGFVLQMVIIVYDYLHDGFYLNWFLSLVLASIIITKCFCCYYEIEYKKLKENTNNTEISE